MVMSGKNFREYLLPLDSPRIVNARGQDPFEYAKPILQRPDARFLIDSWMALYAKPFIGITTDGVKREGLFQLGDEGLDNSSILKTGKALLACLNEEEQAKIQYPINAHEWRSWYNPEFPMNANGLRLDYASPEVRDAVTALMQVSLGPEGYAKIEQTRLTNLHLGELYGLGNIMNEWSYHFLLYGTPSALEPWGWSIYGHHLSVNCFILGRQIVVSPTFLGVEPNIVDRGDQGWGRVFQEEETRGLDLIRSLQPSIRERVITYKHMVGPELPKGRWHFADERHLGASYQDNRIIPYEGVSASEFTSDQQQQVLDLIETFINYLPDRPRSIRMQQIASRLDETYFSWIGGHGEDDPFYYRVQCPLIMVEFDHHSGVWLSNAEPAKFHIHTVVRTPNGNDYGKDLLRQHCERSHGAKDLSVEVDREPFEYHPLSHEDAAHAPVSRAEHDPGNDG
jgi:hypothetical protein